MPIVIAELKKRKKNLKLTTEKLAYLADLPVSTVSKVMTGETKNPSFVTVEKIASALEREETHRRMEDYLVSYRKYVKDYDGKVPDLSNPETPKGIRSNINEFKELGEDRTIELIDGKIISTDDRFFPQHQMTVQDLGYQIEDYIQKNKLKCENIYGGINVRLDEDDYTLAAPDIVVVFDENKLTEDCIEGAPEFVAEIVSPCSRYIDYNTKMHKYMMAGVKEYWVVDYEKEKVSVFIEGEPMTTHLYGFDEQIPVYVFDNKLVIKINTQNIHKYD